MMIADRSPSIVACRAEKEFQPQAVRVVGFGHWPAGPTEGRTIKAPRDNGIPGATQAVQKPHRMPAAGSGRSLLFTSDLHQSA